MKSTEKINKWDIWVAKVAFEDNPKILKIRPVLVLSPTEYYVLSVKITSRSPRNNYFGEYSIRYWKESGLLKPSTIRLSKKINLNYNDLLQKIGVLHQADRQNVEALL